MKTRDKVLCALFAALIAVSAQISIPVPMGVPFTLQTLAILLSGVVLGAKKGTIAVSMYVLMGVIGLPVFNTFQGGIHMLVGATGGFIISFPIMAFISGFFSDRTSKLKISLLGTLTATAVNFIFGTVMFSYVTNSDLIKAFMACVVPFLITGIVKALVASYIGLRIKIAYLSAA